MKKSILAFVLSLVMVLSMTAIPVQATEETQNKTIEYMAGKHFTDDEVDPTTILTVTNVTSQEKKDFSVTLINDGEKFKLDGEKSNVLYCKAPTKITYEPRKDLGYNYASQIMLIYDDSIVDAISPEPKYYEFLTEKQGPDVSNKYDKYADGYVAADGTSITITKAGTYVIYIQPGEFYGVIGKDFKLEPFYIVVSEDEDTSNDTKVTSISLNKTKATLKKGKTTTLTATLTPDNATNQEVIWISSNKKIATVDQNGKVTAKAKGKVTITCKAADGSGEKVTCKVTIK